MNAGQIPMAPIPRKDPARASIQTDAATARLEQVQEQVSGMSMNTNPPTSGLNIPGMKYTRHKTHLHFVPSSVRATVVAFIGEAVGTSSFLLFAFAGTQAANTAIATASTAATLLYISLAFGISLMVHVWSFFRVTGGMFNPAVSLGLALVGSITWSRMLMAWSAQIIGAIVAAALVSGLFEGPLSVSTTLSPGTSIARGVFIEMFLTSGLVFVIFMLAVEKNKATFVAPVGIGLALFIAELAGVAYTGGSLNPARSFAPHVIIGSWPGYHWIYWVGPFLGTLMSVAFYKLVKGMEYEVDNPNAADLLRYEPQRSRTDTFDRMV